MRASGGIYTLRRIRGNEVNKKKERGGIAGRIQSSVVITRRRLGQRAREHRVRQIHPYRGWNSATGRCRGQRWIFRVSRISGTADRDFLIC